MLKTGVTLTNRRLERQPRELRADGGIRTHDLPLTRRLLCQLSYVGATFAAKFWPRVEALG
jgi:hypothetical protein